MNDFTQLNIITAEISHSSINESLISLTEFKFIRFFIIPKKRNENAKKKIGYRSICNLLDMALLYHIPHDRHLQLDN